MLIRVEDFFEFMQIGPEDRNRGLCAAREASERANGMTAIEDYNALAAIALRYRPRRIFEIGTYLGVTSDFLLSLLPEAEVVSIAYKNFALRFLGKRFNNSDLGRRRVGSMVSLEHRPRFTQLLGNSHQLDPNRLLERFGKFDLVFIDGDHSAEGVAEDTELAKSVLSDSGAICWHDANPKPRYAEVRMFLEESLDLVALGTADTYVGGVAVWHPELEKLLESRQIGT